MPEINTNGMNPREAARLITQKYNGSLDAAWMQFSEEKCTRMETRKCPAICIWIGKPEATCARFTLSETQALDLTDEYWRDIQEPDRTRNRNNEMALKILSSEALDLVSSNPPKGKRHATVLKIANQMGESGFNNHEIIVMAEMLFDKWEINPKDNLYLRYKVLTDMIANVRKNANKREREENGH